MSDKGLDTVMCRAVHAAAGELQTEVAEVGPTQVSEADLRRAMRRGLQFQLGPFVRTEVPVPKTGDWLGRIGAFDVATTKSGELRSATEVKWCRNHDSLAEALWDALKLIPFTLGQDELDGAYLVYGAPASVWDAPGTLPAELFATQEHDVRDLVTRYESYWRRWLPKGPNSPRPCKLRSRFSTELLTAVPITIAEAAAWELRCARVQAANALVLFFNDQGLLAEEQPAFGTPAPPSRYVDTDEDIQWDPATTPENRALMKGLDAPSNTDDQ